MLQGRHISLTEPSAKVIEYSSEVAASDSRLRRRGELDLEVVRNRGGKFFQLAGPEARCVLDKDFRRDDGCGCHTQTIEPRRL